MIDSERMHGAMEILTASVHGIGDNPVEWGLAWRNAISKISVVQGLRSC